MERLRSSSRKNVKIFKTRFGGEIELETDWRLIQKAMCEDTHFCCLNRYWRREEFAYKGEFEVLKIVGVSYRRISCGAPRTSTIFIPLYGLRWWKKEADLFLKRNDG